MTSETFNVDRRGSCPQSQEPQKRKRPLGIEDRESWSDLKPTGGARQVCRHLPLQPHRFVSPDSVERRKGINTKVLRLYPITDE